MSEGVFDLAGGPAFPVGIPGSGDNGAWGMSLRDWFAGQAIGKILSLTQQQDGGWDAAAVASGCYAIADAMLWTRALPETGSPDIETFVGGIRRDASSSWAPKGICCDLWVNFGTKPVKLRNAGELRDALKRKSLVVEAAYEADALDMLADPATAPNSVTFFFDGEKITIPSNPIPF